MQSAGTLKCHFLGAIILLRILRNEYRLFLNCRSLSTVSMLILNCTFLGWCVAGAGGVPVHGLYGSLQITHSL